MTLRMKKGFTLIELLVVISIIGILITIGAVSFGSAQRRGRDARRRSDMKSIQTAQEQFYSANNSVYSANPAGLATYFPQGVPVDPRNVSPNTYTFSPTSATSPVGYCTCATLETANTGNASGCTNGVVTYVANGAMFCLGNLQ